MHTFLTLHEIIQKARQKLNHDHWDYIIGGTETETTLRRNRAALDALAMPRVRIATNNSLLIKKFSPPKATMQPNFFFNAEHFEHSAVICRPLAVEGGAAHAGCARQCVAR